MQIFPNKKLLPSRQFMQWAAADSAIAPLKTGKNSAIVSLYLPCEILHSMGISTLFPEALACYLAAARSEQVFIDTAEQNFVSQTMCSYHKAFIGMVKRAFCQSLILSSTQPLHVTQITCRSGEQRNTTMCLNI